MVRFFVGLFSGITLGIVLAPARGKETRNLLRSKAEHWRERQVAKGRDTARDVGSAVAEKLYDRAVGEEHQ